MNQNNVFNTNGGLLRRESNCHKPNTIDWAMRDTQSLTGDLDRWKTSVSGPPILLSSISLHCSHHDIAVEVARGIAKKRATAAVVTLKCCHAPETMLHEQKPDKTSLNVTRSTILLFEEKVSATFSMFVARKSEHRLLYLHEQGSRTWNADKRRSQ